MVLAADQMKELSDSEENEDNDNEESDDGTEGGTPRLADTLPCTPLRPESWRAGTPSAVAGPGKLVVTAVG